MSERKERLGYIDLLKFFAIACVILGHCTEQITGNDFWTNPIWSFIYSFHMPLFMMLCGYFFGSSLKLSFAAMLRKKSVQLLVPSLTMTVILYGFICFTGINPFPEMLGLDVVSVINVLWFLKCVLLCYLIAYVSLKLIGNVAVSAVLTSMFFLLLPGGDIVNLNFLLPMFWIGYALNIGREWCMRHGRIMLEVSAVAFWSMIPFWSGLFTVYEVPIAIIDWHGLAFDSSNFAVAVFRFLIGLAGSIMFFMLAPWVDAKVKSLRCYPAFLSLGRATLGIYVVQTIVVECGLHMASIYLTTAQSLVFAPMLAVCGICVCYGIVIALRRWGVTRLLLLGQPSAPVPRLEPQQ